MAFELIDNKLRVYPNPVKDILSIKSETTAPTGSVFLIYDVSGKLQVKGIWPANRMEVKIDVYGLKDGIYEAQILNESGINSIRFVVTK